MIEMTAIRSIPIQLFRIFVVITMTVGVQLQGAMSQSEDEAYEHNRQGMIAMSQAEF